MTHRITPYPHELRRFQEAGSVLIVREMKPQPVRFSHVDVPYWQWTPGAEPAYYGFHALIPQVVWRDGLNPFECGAAAGMERLCPFPATGEEVWFAEEFRAWQWSDPHIEYRGGGIGFEGDERCYLLSDGLTEADVDRSLDSGKQQPSRWLPASEMPEWAARLRGVVVSRECRRLDQATQRLVTERDGCGLRSRHKLRYHWTKNSKAQFDADPWAWVMRVERKEAGA